MPEIFNRSVGEIGIVAVWKIAEPIDFFLQEIKPVKSLRNDKKILQHLTGRYLLKQLLERSGLARWDQLEYKGNKPTIEKIGVSISHSGLFAAAAMIQGNSIGVDIQLIDQRIFSIRHKFLHRDEIDLLEAMVGSDEHYESWLLSVGGGQDSLGALFTVAWAAKEAVFKRFEGLSVNVKDIVRIKKIQFNERFPMMEILVAFTEHREVVQGWFTLLEGNCLFWTCST